MKILTTKIHGVLDYAVSIILILTPLMFGFAESGNASFLIPRILGVAIVILGLLTKYEFGLIKIIFMKAHIAADYVIGIFLALSPWLFGFSKESVNIWVPHLVIGLLIFGITLVTQSETAK